MILVEETFSDHINIKIVGPGFTRLLFMATLFHTLVVITAASVLAQNCVNDVPTTETNAVQITFYTNTAGTGSERNL